MISGILCDLDGVVYRGHQPCEGAVQGLSSVRSAGVRVLFLTNNASRSPQDVADQLMGLGVQARAEEVLTASQVAASLLAKQRPDLLSSGSVLAVGGPGVALALTEAGFTTMSCDQAREVAETGVDLELPAVVQGYGPELGVQDLAEAAYAIRAGATWVATNDDATLPTVRGLAPGNGSLVSAVARATGATPLVAGKPHATAYEVALERLGLPASATLMVGDRLDTDIVGARASGLVSALVLTGVSTREEAESAPAEARPDHVVPTIPDLAHLWGGR